MDSAGLFWIKVQWREGWNNCTRPKWGLPASLPACLGPIYPPNLHLNLHLHLKLCSTFGGIIAQYRPVAPSICPGKVQPLVIRHLNCYIELCNGAIIAIGQVGMWACHNCHNCHNLFCKKADCASTFFQKSDSDKLIKIKMISLCSITFPRRRMNFKASLPYDWSLTMCPNVCEVNLI